MPREPRWDVLDKIAERAHTIRKRFPALSTNYVPGEGDYPEAFIIGEAPGAQEDIKRRPFVGDSGIVLRQLMALASLGSEDWECTANKTYGVANCWLTNVVKFRPPGNRNPTPEEIRAFRGLIVREWHAVGEPPLIIPVGGIALSLMFGRRISILRAAGKCHYTVSRAGKRLAVWPMVHPSYVIRQRGNVQLQELIEQDWERLGVWRNNDAC